jgi:hypothetical protein
VMSEGIIPRTSARWKLYRRALRSKLVGDAVGRSSLPGRQVPASTGVGFGSGAFVTPGTITAVRRLPVGHARPGGRILPTPRPPEVWPLLSKLLALLGATGFEKQGSWIDHRDKL